MPKILLEWLPTIWGWIAYLFPAVITFLTARLAVLADVPTYLVIFYSTGVLAFCTVAAVAVDMLIKRRVVFERLHPKKTVPHLINPDKRHGDFAILLSVILMNVSWTQTIYFKIRRAKADLQNNANSQAVLKDEIGIAPPRSEMSIQIAAVPGIDVGSTIAGNLEIEILYGRRPSKMRYVMAYETKPAIQINKIEFPEADITFVSPVQKYTHNVA